MKLFVVGKIGEENPFEWEFMGIFDDQKIAEGHCKDKTFFVGPCNLNEYTGDERIYWSNGYFPKGDK